MRNRAQYIFVALSAMAFITMAVSIVLFFLLVPKGITEMNGDGTVTVTPRWVVALPLFLVEVIVEGLMCVNALISSGWVRASGTWANLFGRRSFAMSSHVALGHASSSRLLRRGGGKRRSDAAAKAALPDPYMRRVGVSGNIMLMVSLLILFVICGIVAEYRHPEQSWTLVALPVVLLFIAELACVEKGTERRIRQDNR